MNRHAQTCILTMYVEKMQAKKQTSDECPGKVEHLQESAPPKIIHWVKRNFVDLVQSFPLFHIDFCSISTKRNKRNNANPKTRGGLISSTFSCSEEKRAKKRISQNCQIMNSSTRWCSIFILERTRNRDNTPINGGKLSLSYLPDDIRIKTERGVGAL